MFRQIIKKILPDNLVKKLGILKWKYIDDYVVKSYSQYGEDIILRNLFVNKDDGFYVDVGAYHPKFLSNTYYFYKKGWRGINIDATPGSMKLFRKIRPRDINVEAAISSERKILKFFIFDGENKYFNTFSEEFAKKWGKSYKDVVEIQTTTLGEILDKYIPPGQEIDFLSVDVEGLDYDVLLSNNWQKYRPKVIVVEVKGKTIEDILKSEIYMFLKEKNYEFFAKTFCNAIFVGKDFLEARFNDSEI